MNINPAAKRVLCFGDSNTWGYIPGGSHHRYAPDVRWTGILQNLLGNDFEVIEEGLNSRGIVKGDPRPGKEGRSAIEYILPCLDTHDPLDYAVLFLGTNELKAEFDLSAMQIARNLEDLIEMISSKPSQFRDTKPQIIVIVPPVLDETTEYALKGNKYIGAHKKSLELKGEYKKIAQEMKCSIVDVQNKLLTGSDGVHLLPESHKLLAEEICRVIRGQ
jgi:lysophospholipase L1-like esterase